MAQKIFKRIGLRRDKNLSDVSNPVTSLNSLLDTLVDFPGSTFISQDLDCIRNLFAEGMRNSNFLEFAGSSLTIHTEGGGYECCLSYFASSADFAPIFKLTPGTYTQHGSTILVGEGGSSGTCGHSAETHQDNIRICK